MRVWGIVGVWGLGCGPPPQAEPPLAVDPARPEVVEAAAPVATGQDNGVSMALYLDRLEGAEGPLRQDERVRARLELRYADGSPAEGLRPAAWLGVPLLAADITGPEPGGSAAERCRARAQQHAGATLFGRALLDLNGYHVLTLGVEPSLSVVDPRFGFGGSRLLQRVALSAPGRDWAEQGDTLLVALEDSTVVTLDTTRWDITDIRPLDAERLAVDPAGRIWALTPQDVHVLGPPDQALGLGEGPHAVAFDPERGLAFVSSAGAGTLTLVSLAELRVLQQLRIGAEPVEVVWSQAAQAAVVVHRSGALRMVDAEGRVQATLEGPPGVTRLRFAPDGRRALLVAPESDLVAVLDTAAGRVVQTARIPGAPDAVQFTDTLAYLRLREDATVWMLPLETLGLEGQALQVVDFPGGTRPPGPSAWADPIVPTPEPGTVLVANPADESIYYYQEGMAAPMGSFPTPAEHPKAVRVLDRSLRPLRPGAYTAVVQLPAPGPYELAVLLTQPAAVACLALEVEAGPDGTTRPEARWTAPTEAQLGQPVDLRVEVRQGSAALGPEALPGAAFILVRAEGLHSQRVPAQRDAAGGWSLRFTPDTPGVWRVHLAAEGLSAAALTPAQLTVHAESPG